MTSGEWRVTSGEWRVTSGEWRVTSGEWRVTSGLAAAGVQSKLALNETAIRQHEQNKMQANQVVPPAKHAPGGE